jgi:hypothetical protein
LFQRELGGKGQAGVPAVQQALQLLDRAGPNPWDRVVDYLL